MFITFLHSSMTLVRNQAWKGFNISFYIVVALPIALFHSRLLKLVPILFCRFQTVISLVSSGVHCRERNSPFALLHDLEKILPKPKCGLYTVEKFKDSHSFLFLPLWLLMCTKTFFTDMSIISVKWHYTELTRDCTFSTFPNMSLSKMKLDQIRLNILTHFMYLQYLSNILRSWDYLNLLVEFFSSSS